MPLLGLLAFFIAGALGTMNGVVKSIASATVGLVWTAVSPSIGFGLAAMMMAAGTLVLIRSCLD